MLSSVARILALAAVCLTCVTTAARAQLVESPLDSEEAAEEGLPFRGSSFGFSQTVSGNSFFRSSQLSFNPTYSWGFSADLLWHFNRIFQLALNQELEVELTDSDTTTLRREPLLSDTAVTFDARVLKQKYGSELSWTLHTSASLLAPTSLASQAASMVLGTRVGAAASASFPKVMNGLSLSGSVGYLHRWLTSNVVQAEEDYPCNAGQASRALCGQLGSRTNTRNSITAGLRAVVALGEKWGLSLSYSHAWRRGADLADFTYVSDDGTSERLRDGGDRHWRNLNILDLSVSYDVMPWLGLALSASNTFSDRGPNSELRAPLHPADTYLGLGVILKLDELYLATTSSSARHE